MGFKKLNASLGLSMDQGDQIRDPVVLAKLEIWLKRNPAWSGESAGLILGAEQPSVRSSAPAQLELLSQTINPSLLPFPGSQDVRRAIGVPALCRQGLICCTFKRVQETAAGARCCAQLPTHPKSAQPAANPL